METLRSYSETLPVRRVSLTSIFYALIETSCFVLLIFTVVGLFGPLHWGADLANHARPFYLIGGVALVAVSLFFGHTIGFYTSLAIVAINGFLVVPYLLHKIKAPPAAENSITLMSANTLYGNYAPQELINTIDTVDPDILILQEMGASNQQKAAILWEKFPYVTDTPNRGTKEVLVFSKFPFDSVEYIAFDTPWRAQAHVTFTVNGQSFKVIGVHPKAPMSAGRFERRNIELQKLAAEAASVQTPIIVAGDMNITPWTPIFHRFLNESNLSDSRKRNGLNFTWAPHDVPLLIPIDQILYRNVDMHSFTSGPYTGSDHRPVIATFSLPTADNNGSLASK